MAFILEPFVTDLKIAQLTSDGKIYMPMEIARKISSLYVTFRYTKGAETDLSIVYDVRMKQYDNAYLFRILSATNPAEAYTTKLGASGNSIVPLPIPIRTEALIISTTNVGAFGDCYVGFASDEGIISPR